MVIVCHGGWRTGVVVMSFGGFLGKPKKTKRLSQANV